MSLYAIGVGINCRLHLTVEARQAIRACNTLFALTPDADCLSLLRSVNPCAEIVDCADFYRDHLTRPEAYDEIVERVLQRSSRFCDTGIVTYGHPMFLVSAVERLISRAAETGMTVHVIPGISSFDTLLSDLRLDLGYGVQMYDAALLLSVRPPLSTLVPLVIFQAANSGSTDIERSTIPLGRLAALQEYLLGLYPRDHLCRFVVSRRSLFDPCHEVQVSLGEMLNSHHISLSDRPTILVPEVPIG